MVRFGWIVRLHWTHILCDFFKIREIILPLFWLLAYSTTFRIIEFEQCKNTLKNPLTPCNILNFVIWTRWEGWEKLSWNNILCLVKKLVSLDLAQHNVFEKLFSTPGLFKLVENTTNTLILVGHWLGKTCVKNLDMYFMA